jgi:hypothetical protein
MTQQRLIRLGQFVFWSGWPIFLVFVVVKPWIAILAGLSTMLLGLSIGVYAKYWMDS